MILTGNKIQEEVENKKIFIEPFYKKHITTNSYDLTLSNKFIVYHDEVLDPKKKPTISDITIPEGGYYELKKAILSYDVQMKYYEAIFMFRLFMQNHE